MEEIFDISICRPKTAWSITSDGFFAIKIKEQLIKEEIPQESVDKMFNNAVNILSNCPNPDIDEPNSKTGVIIGKVQSGKTSNFISLMALAFDNKYDIVIVLGGTTNILLNQNYKRISTYFENIKKEKLVILSTKNKAILNPSTIKLFIQEGRKVVIVGLKNGNGIDIMKKIFFDNYLSNIPTLVIDDEGDQATLNTKAFKKAMSATYEAAITLKSHLKRHCFLSITATPQANILIKTCDELSPDFGVLIYPGDNYCGLEEYHGEHQDKYIRVIPNNEPSILDNGLPNSFYCAFASFFLGGAIRRYRGDFKNHAMLVHPSHKKFDHKIVIDKINNLINQWKQQANIKLNGIDDISYKPLQTHLVNAYKVFSDDGVKIPRFSEIEPLALQCIKECPEAHLCNSDEDASKNSEYFQINIFVGGNMVERGLTIKGLAVTYIVRRAKGVSSLDNTEQRARWFGYKRGFLDVCRVFTTQVIKDDFSDILEHDDDLWATIERAQIKGTAFKDIPRVFVLANKLLQMTRKCVAKTSKLDYSEWNKQNRLLLERGAVAKNDRLLIEYRNNNLSDLQNVRYPGVNDHVVLKNINFFEFKKKVLNNWVFPNDNSIDKIFFDNLEEALEKSNICPIVDIFWIRDTTHETRTLKDDDKINQLFQGRNSDQSSQKYYPGDSSMVSNDRSDVMQLQIHYIKPLNRPEIDYYSPALAIYIPALYSAQMAHLVGGQS